MRVVNLLASCFEGTLLEFTLLSADLLSRKQCGWICILTTYDVVSTRPEVH